MGSGRNSYEDYVTPPDCVAAEVPGSSVGWRASPETIPIVIANNSHLDLACVDWEKTGPGISDCVAQAAGNPIFIPIAVQTN